MKNSKLQGYFGFARKSRTLVSGYETCIQMIKRKKIKLVLITSGASERTREKFRKLCEKEGIPLIWAEDPSWIEEMTGLSGRNIFGITDTNLAKAIAKEIETMSM